MQLNRQQAQQIQEDRAGFAKLRETLAGKNLTPEDYEIALTQSPDPSHQKLGIEMRFKRIRLADLDKEMSGGVKPAAEAPMAAPAEVPMAAPVAPMAAPLDIKEIGDYRVDRNISPTNLAKLIKIAGQETFKIQPNEYFGDNEFGGLEIKTLPTATTSNNLAAQVAPAAAAPVANAMLAQPAVGNAMASKQARIAQINKDLATLTKPQYYDLDGVKGRIANLDRELKQLTESPFAKESRSNFTSASLAKFGQSGNPADLVPVGKEGTKSDLARLMSERAALVASGVALTDNRVVAYDNAITKASAPSAGQPSELTRLIAERAQAVTSGASPQILASYDAAINKQINFAPLQPKDDPKTTAAFREVDAAGNVTFYNKFGNPISTQKNAGKPSATFEKTTAQRKQLSSDLTTAINELTDITKDGGLIDQSTGSGAGRLVDLAAGFGGIATPGAIAIGKLQPVADLVLKMIPRFEGPQSNADTTSYKQAAAQLADPTLPAAIRKEAGKTVLRLMIKRKGQFVTQSMADEGTVPGGAVPAANVDDLLDKYK